MSTFVLVHGAWQSVGTWDLLVPYLREQGHAVVTPVLRGLGTDQSNLNPEITLRHHIDDVSSQLTKLNGKAILVGHSYAGMIISGAVESEPTRVQNLVFLDAFIPDNHHCVLDLLPPDTGAFFRDVAKTKGDGWRLPGGEGQLDLWGLKPGPARDFVRARLCDFSLRCFEEPISLPENRKVGLPASFVSCVANDYPSRPFFAPFASKARAAGWQVTELKTGHDCHVENPRGVAEVLLSAGSPQQ